MTRANPTLHILESVVSHTEGTHETFHIEVLQAASKAELQVHRHEWPTSSETVIRAQMFISYDSGRKWHLLIGFEAPGGKLDGTVSSAFRPMKPQYKTHKRLLKAIINCKIPLTIETKIEVW